MTPTAATPSTEASAPESSSAEPWTVGSLIERSRPRLAEASFEPSPREAASLLGHVLGWTEIQVLSRAERPVAAGDVARFQALLERRLAGEPMAYLKGAREFYGRSFEVDSRVLIPRPETEHLVEAVLTLALPAPTRVLDLGTGSGILAITLAAELPGSWVVAGDLSPAALALAQRNARRLLPAGRVRWLGADLDRGLEIAGFDLVVSNPPYVDPAQASRLSPEILDFEPHLALFAADEGLACLRHLVWLGSALRAGAFLALEIGDGQLEALLALARGAGLGIEEVRADYAGKPRVVVLKRP